jgi:hypothetical protein
MKKTKKKQRVVEEIDVAGMKLAIDFHKTTCECCSHHAVVIDTDGSPVMYLSIRGDMDDARRKRITDRIASMLNECELPPSSLQ